MWVYDCTYTSFVCVLINLNDILFQNYKEYQPETLEETTGKHNYVRKAPNQGNRKTS